MKAIALLGIGALAAIATYSANWLALIPWRKATGRHWSEQARTVFPARAGAAGSLWIVPVAFALFTAAFFPDQAPHWAFVAVAASWGAVMGTLPMDREVFPRIPMRTLARQAAAIWIIRFLMLFVLAGAGALMPEQFGWEGILIACCVLGLLIVWNLGGWIHVCKKLGMIVAPPERLQRVVDQTAARMSVHVAATFLLRSPIAQAYAVPGTKQLLFSERLLEILSDDELAAICAHELGHLMERRSQYLMRHIIWLMFFPWIFISPLCQEFGIFGLFGAGIATMLIPLLSRTISRRLEIKADRVAADNERSPGTYARALAKLYEDGLVPAVSPADHRTHPHLYDRLLEAGVTPDFPRPSAPSSLAPQTLVFSVIIGLCAVRLIMRS